MIARLRSVPPGRFDAGVALLVFVAGVIESVGTEEPAGREALTVALLAGMCASIAFRRRRPLAVVCVFFAFGIVLTLVSTSSAEFASPFLLILVLAYTVGTIADTRTAVLGAGLCVLGVCGVTTAMGDPIVGDYIFPSGFCLAAWGIGRTIRHRSLLAAELHEAAVRAEEEREEAAARAVADERRRIAREMHDVIAHSVSVMVVQAGGARRILDRDPGRAIDAAELIEQTGRSALAEMRSLLGVLSTGDEGPALAPQPSLGDVEGLVERARDAGLPVTLGVEGDPRPLPAGAEAAAYRVVQEALTNALKHAAAAPTDVLLRWDADGLEIVVADRGRGGAPAPATSLPGSGHGIVGMRERVLCYDGSLSAVPRPGGGFVVRARIPLHQEQLQVA